MPKPRVVGKARRGPKRKLVAGAFRPATDAPPHAAEAITTREVHQAFAKRAREARMLKRLAGLMTKLGIVSLPRELDGELLDDLTLHTRDTVSKLSPIILGVWKDLVNTSTLYRKQGRSDNSSHDKLVHFS